MFTLDITANFFNNLGSNFREFLILGGFQVPPRQPMVTNHKGNQSIILVRNADEEAEKKIRTIKAAMQPVSGSLHHRTFMGTIGRNPSIKIYSLGSSFQDEKKISMLADALEEYALDSEESAYEDPG